MKRFVTMMALFAALFALGGWQQKAAAQPGGVGVAITYQDFYDGLSPYGEWIDFPEYGYVWRPTGINDFQPYSTGGRWVWSDDYEWMWVSDYDWGWAPFHYGRWFLDPFYGWMWVPGYEWGPAWVAWRDGGDYYGWAPLRPGIHISVNFNIGRYNPPIDYWCFTPRRYITSNRLWNHCLPRRQNVTIINNTTIINNYGRYGGRTFAAGPRRMDVERYTGRVNSVRFRELDRPGRTQIRRNEVSVYRPDIRRDNNRNFAPRQFNRYDRSERVATNNTVRNERTNRNVRSDRQVGTDRNNNIRGNRNNEAVRNNNDRRQFNNRNNNSNTRTDRQPQIENRVRTDRQVRENRIERRQPDRTISDRRVAEPGNPRVRTERNPSNRREIQAERRSGSENRRIERSSPSTRTERANPAPRMERNNSAPRMERNNTSPRMERSSPRMERREQPSRSERSPQGRSSERRGGRQ
ncbi:MAG: DUF6600 domain-containing protein [Chitinophagaceae bacterium]